MEDCIFCKIAAGNVPSYTVYEDKNFKAFLDIHPVNKGHVLVIPKKHFRWVWDVPNIGKYYEIAGKIANAQRKAFGTEWVVSIVLGEAVPHAHIWLVPRFTRDGHGPTLLFTKRKSFSKKEMVEIQEQIVSALKS